MTSSQCPMAFRRLLLMLMALILSLGATGPGLRADDPPAGGESPAVAPEGEKTAPPAEGEETAPPEAEKKAPINVADEGKVREALDKGVAYLKKQQRSNGAFAGLYHTGVASSALPGLHSGGYPLGETAIALLAMEYAGVPWADESFQKGLKFILENQSKKSYSNSLVAQVLAALPAERRTDEIKKRMQGLASFFEESQLPGGTWTYYPVTNQQMKTSYYLCGDNSNTQFAVLGLWMLARAGVEINPKVWQAAESHFMKTQQAAGGWGYWTPQALLVGGGREDKRVALSSTPSMTMTGLASLFIFLEQLHIEDATKFSGSRTPRCSASVQFERRIDKAMETAETDLDQWFRAKRMYRAEVVRRGRTDVKYLNMMDLYYIYSAERVGEASGWKHFGTLDWYNEIGKFLLEEQNQDGSWGVPPPKDMKDAELQVESKGAPLVSETALAMLFLAKGRSPMFFNKLRYDGDWNNCRLDIANVTRYATMALEYRFNWQVVDIKGDVYGWLDSPVLYFNGQQGPGKLTPDEKKKLKEFVNQDGLIFAEACCGRPGFVTLVRRIGSELWPDLQWQELPEDHPLYTQKTQFDLKEKPPLWALVNKDGFAFFILAPKDLSAYWHNNLVTTHMDKFQFAINVYRYANRGKPIRTRAAK